MIGEPLNYSRETLSIYNNFASEQQWVRQTQSIRV